MASYRIICVNQEDCSSKYAHIVGVGTGDHTGWDRQWTVAQVWEAMRQGHRFFTYGGGLWAEVHEHRCACGRGTLRSAADATTQNNLDNMTYCQVA